MIKRIFDLTVSVVGLIAISPFFLLLMLLVRIKMGSPVFFSQVRPGKDEKLFRMYKFRSMTNEIDKNGNLLANQKRLTPFGKFLRSSSLDELPELINVIKGDMSLVGPRPLRIDYLMMYNREQKKRHNVQPGITGWAQVNGRNKITWEQKFKLDVWYVENKNFWLDMKILFKTFFKVFTREDINQSQEKSMPKFKGSPSYKSQGNES